MKIHHAMNGATLLLMGSVMLGGCTGTTVRPSMTPQATKTYSIVAVGDITGSDELWHSYTVEIHRELAAGLIADKAFTQVLDPVPAPLPGDALVVTGHITEVNKGSTAARWLVGFGAGRAYLTTEFELKDANGSKLGSYTVRKTYAGGAGIGGANLLDMDDLARKLGKEAADSLSKWAKTGKFEQQ